MNGPDYAALFANKIIEPGEYLAKLTSVQQIKTESGRYIYQVEVLLDCNEKPEDGTRLSAILQPTIKGQKFIDAFFESYRATEQTVQQAVGRFAAVYVYNSGYKGSHFSVVKFHPQAFQAREKVAEVESEASSIFATFVARPKPSSSSSRPC